MEGLSVNACKGLRRYWKRRSYERLNGQEQPYRTQRKVRVQLARLGPPPPSSPSPKTTTSAKTITTSAAGGRRRSRRRFWRWRVKISPKIRIGSPKKWLTRLRDAYVKMMLSFANSAAFSGGFGGGAAGGFGRAPLKEYDKKMIVEIYKSVVMVQGQIVPGEAGKLCVRDGNW